MTLYRRTDLTYILVYILIVFTVAACSGSATTETVSIDVSIDGETMRPKDIVVTHNDLLVMNITSDRSGSIHVHGYNLEHSVEQGVRSSFEMNAHATGKFNIAFHNSDHGHGHSAEHDEVIIGSLTVRPD